MLRRRQRREDEEREIFEQRQKMQFDRSLGHILDGTATKEDTDYFYGYERQIDRFSVRRSKGNGEERITKIAITIVDFIRKEINPEIEENNLGEELAA